MEVIQLIINQMLHGKLEVEQEQVENIHSLPLLEVLVIMIPVVGVILQAVEAVQVHPKVQFLVVAAESAVLTEVRLVAKLTQAVEAVEVTIQQMLVAVVLE